MKKALPCLVLMLAAAVPAFSQTPTPTAKP
jgi:hypothetical protein